MSPLDGDNALPMVQMNLKLMAFNVRGLNSPYKRRTLWKSATLRNAHMSNFHKSSQLMTQPKEMEYSLLSRTLYPVPYFNSNGALSFWLQNLTAKSTP